MIERYKFEEKWGWALIFGRIAVGALELDPDNFRHIDLILPSPPSPGRFDHARIVLQQAAKEAPPTSAWPFDLSEDPTLVKTVSTPRMSQTKGIAERASAATDLRDALYIHHPERTLGRTVLVYDDTFTTGNTLNEVACALRRQGGADSVCGLTLCRQPWTRPP